MDWHQIWEITSAPDNVPIVALMFLVPFYTWYGFRQALANLQAVAAEAGGEMTDIVKLTIFVTDKAAYQANLKPIGEAYRSFFGRYYPAMTLVEVKSLFDDEAMVEIEGMAILKT